MFNASSFIAWLWAEWVGDHQTASAFRALATAQERAFGTQGEKGRVPGVVPESGPASLKTPLSEGTRAQEVGGCAGEFGGVWGGWLGEFKEPKQTVAMAS